MENNHVPDRPKRRPAPRVPIEDRTLFYHPDFAATARKISEMTGIVLGSVKWDKFKDRWYDELIENLEEDVEMREVYFLGDFSKPETTLQNVYFAYALTRYFANKVQVIVPYFPVGTMERVAVEGEVATARGYMRMLSATPAAERGMTSYHTIDIHDLRLRFYGFDDISTRLWSGAAPVRERLAKLGDRATVAFPDEGAAKRFGNDYKGFPQIVCTKVRKGDERKITIVDGDPAGRDVVLVDDLIQSGGTLREAAKVLRAAGAKSVGAYATHGVFPEDSHRKLCDELDFVWTTDSIPANVARAAESGGKMECMSIAPLVAEIIRRT